ncbi:beta-ketoacyl-[acyl-carrier-protein] synthase family protein [Propionibacterium acidifaciens]
MTGVVVTGIGAVSPAGVGIIPLWKAVSSGRSLLKGMMDSANGAVLGGFEFGSVAIGEVPDLEKHLDSLPREVRRLDRFVQLAVLAASEAVQDSGLENKMLSDARAGIAFATAICGTTTLEREFVRVTGSGMNPVDPNAVSHDLYLAAMSNTPAIVLSAMLGTQGPVLALSTGCVGGIDAVGAACAAIEDGEADVMIAGASEAPITPITIASFEIINCLSRRTQGPPSTASRPFDAERDGFVLAEGSGFLVLESADHARARGARPYMRIGGFALASNARHMTALEADGRDLARAMGFAVDRSGVDPRDIEHVSAHGSSTIQNDRCETTAIKKTLGDHAYEVPVTSVKSMIGHPLSAASTIELVVCAKSFQEDFLSPTANYEAFDPECDLNYVPGSGVEWLGRSVLKQASGFGGLHAAMTLHAIG